MVGGRYQIISSLGRGGMGAVYRAWDARLNVPVALKEMMPQPGLDPHVEGSPEFSCPDADTPSECPPTPRRGFGAMWCDTPEIRNRLGDATDCERGYTGSMQPFERAFMLRTDDGAIYVFYDNGRWE